MKYLIYRHISPSGKSYIGLTNNLQRRTNKHKSGTSGSTAFTNAIKKYGWDTFTTEILSERLTLGEAVTQEQYYIKELDTLYPNGYNLTSGGECRDFTIVTRQKMSDTARRNMTEDRKQRIREARLGTIQSDETKQRRRISSLGRRHSEKTKQKISMIRTGSQRSDKTKQKLREARKHQKIKHGSESPNYINISDETLNKIITEYEKTKQVTKKFAASIGVSVYIITRKLKELGYK